MTMCRRPGRMPGRLSKVLRPMIIALPMVSCLNRLRSPGNVPGKVAVLADHAVDGAGEDDGDRAGGPWHDTLPLGRGFAKPLRDDPNVASRLLLLSLLAAMPAEAETVQLRAGHLIDPGTGTVTHDRAADARPTARSSATSRGRARSARAR